MPYSRLRQKNVAIFWYLDAHVRAVAHGPQSRELTEHDSYRFAAEAWVLNVARMKELTEEKRFSSVLWVVRQVGRLVDATDAKRE
jgi:hypothetical protein